MAYDDLKSFRGQKYTGMRVGAEHVWAYPNGVWRERKVAPDRWDFTFASPKERKRAAPVGSGVPPKTQYHWYLLAHQRVRKVNQDRYLTSMNGVKYKIAHKRPHWRKWSSQYPDQPSERERVIAILEEAVAQLRGGSESPPFSQPASTPPDLRQPTLGSFRRSGVGSLEP